MTPSQELLSLIRESAQRAQRATWVIVKRGMYYLPNAHGYTSCLCEAWHLTLEEAKKYEMYADRPDVAYNEKVFIKEVPPLESALPRLTEALEELIEAIDSSSYDKWNPSWQDAALSRALVIVKGEQA